MKQIEIVKNIVDRKYRKSTEYRVSTLVKKCEQPNREFFLSFISLSVQRPENKEPEYHACDTIDTEEPLLTGCHHW